MPALKRGAETELVDDDRLVHVERRIPAQETLCSEPDILNERDNRNYTEGQQECGKAFANPPSSEHEVSPERGLEPSAPHVLVHGSSFAVEGCAFESLFRCVAHRSGHAGHPFMNPVHLKLSTARDTVIPEFVSGEKLKQSSPFLDVHRSLPRTRRFSSIKDVIRRT